MSQAIVFVLDARFDCAERAAAWVGRQGHRAVVIGSPADIRMHAVNAPVAVLIGEVPEGDFAAWAEVLRPLTPRAVFIAHAQCPGAETLARAAGAMPHIETFPGSANLSQILAAVSATSAIVDGGVRQVGASPAMCSVRQLIAKVAACDSTVLVLGPSGSGKELVARTLHSLSDRRNKPFVAINCGAIPSELLESELFGHEKGAFTGALSARKGRFEIAEGGTLFLDEIGDMSMSMQVKLLRVLQERVFERVGSDRSQRCNVRIIAATHRDLETAIAEGRFREDLFYRLNVFPIEVPALRERLADLPELVEEFARRLRARGLVPAIFTPQALAALQKYDWPGNIRELANLVERMAILAPGTPVTVADLPSRYRVHADPAVRASVDVDRAIGACEGVSLEERSMLLPGTGIDLRDHLARIEIGLIQQALSLSGGVVAQAANLLRIKRTTLVEKLRKYDLRDVQMRF